MNRQTLLNLQHTFAVGALGEFIAKQFLESFGYLVQTTQDKKSGDLIAIRNEKRFKIEVKTSRKTKRGQFHFQLFKCDKHGSTNHLNSDIVLLLAVTQATIYFYIVPTKALRYKQKVAITSHPTQYKGQLAKYRHKSPTLQLTSVE